MHWCTVDNSAAFTNLLCGTDPDIEAEHAKRAYLLRECFLRKARSGIQEVC
ncbi:hypothetical protein [Anaplasma phagocytophilum]|uniref:Uncharacterized protein n=1 Tax=Anaplasma phagocytophilum str. CRT53-1 TaxID=1359157 RepID=A0A0F3Q2F0_ANAPH|nr:hypothetical protein [Anaplasma phagocytophilum]KJV86658.1 hypothetical protein APHCRT_0461 [Anaplasma phagocytophilum str. CRT53-1]